MPLGGTTAPALLVVPVGAVANGIADDGVALVTAIAQASAIGTLANSLAVVDLGGRSYRMTTTTGLRVLPFVVLQNGTILNDALAADEAGVYFGNRAGGD